MKSNRTQLGFTLIELMVTVAVAGILLAVGIPSFRQMIQDNRLVTAANRLTADLNLGRSEAIKRGLQVTFCKRNTTGTACDASAAWSGGWLVFVDLDGDGVLDDDGDTTPCEATEDCLLRVMEPLAPVSLDFGRNRITYDGRGYASGFNGTFSICDERGAGKAKGRVLSNQGRLRTSTSGDTLSCP